MQRAFSRDSVRSNAGVGPRLRQNERESSLPFWGEVQATIGNEAAEALREGRATSGDELYLIDLLRAASETGHDLSAYLPWRASLSWNTFARAWYRVIWTERDRLGPAPTSARRSAPYCASSRPKRPASAAPTASAPSTTSSGSS
jgi:hypothetical protein